MKTHLTFKTITAFFGLLLISANLSAQQSGPLAKATENYDQGFRLGIGINGGIPLDDTFDWSLGGDVRLQYDLSKFTSVTLTTGFTNFFIGDDAKDFGFIPVKAGFKGFVVGNELYLMGEVGGAFGVTNGYSDSSMLLSPGIGYATRNIDISARYEYFSNFYNADGDKGLGQVALRFAYGFRL